jgi:sigma-B regulation protein RsbU (phosphoserine phosphatase)
MNGDELLSHVPLLASLSPDEIRRLAATLRRETIEEGTLLFMEGQVGHHLYVLLEGQVEILKALGTDGERLLGVRGPGSFIGEMSLFNEGGRHTASVRARTPLRLIAMPRTDLEALLSRQPGLSYEMIRTMSQRLEESENLTIHDLLEKNRQLTQAYTELKAAQEQLLEKERLEAELDVARAIQRSILPHARPQLPGFDFGTLIEPVSSVGGDLFDFIPLRGGRLGIAIGDVSGHGVPSAIFMALAYSLLRAEASRGSTPTRVLQNVNRLLLDMSDSGMFVTMLYGILDGGSRQFTYARAGHSVPLLIAPTGEVTSPDFGIGQPLGLFDDLLLDERSITIPAGGLLFVFTDGVTEAADENGLVFGQERLLAVLRNNARASAQDICQAAYDAVRAFCGALAPQDDVLLVTIQAQ